MTEGTGLLYQADELESLASYKQSSLVGSFVESMSIGDRTYVVNPPRRKATLAASHAHLLPAVERLCTLPWGSGHRAEFPVHEISRSCSDQLPFKVR